MVYCSSKPFYEMGFKEHLVKTSEEKIKLFCSHGYSTFYAFEQPLTWLGNLTMQDGNDICTPPRDTVNIQIVTPYIRKEYIYQTFANALYTPHSLMIILILNLIFYLGLETLQVWDLEHQISPSCKSTTDV